MKGRKVESRENCKSIKFSMARENFKWQELWTLKMILGSLKRSRSWQARARNTLRVV